MKKYVSRKLIIPLLALSLLSSFLSFFLPQPNLSSLLLNLATELLGIIVTIWFVDRILRAYEEKRWEKSKSSVCKRLEIFCFESFIRLNNIIDLRGIVLPAHLIGTGQVIYVNNLIFGEHRSALAKEIRNRITSEPLDEEAFEALKRLSDDILRIIDAFSSLLEPVQFSYLLNTFEELHRFMARYFGLLHNRRYERIVLVHTGYNIEEESLLNTIQILAEMLRSLTPKSLIITEFDKMIDFETASNY